MNAWLIPDRIEEQSWARHYQQIAREETEAELADDPKKVCPNTCLNRYASIICNVTGPAKAISRAFDDDVDFQERMAEHIRYMAETIARHQINIDSEV